jgi:hypothetical protein
LKKVGFSFPPALHKAGGFFLRGGQSDSAFIFTGGRAMLRTTQDSLAKSKSLKFQECEQ